MFALGCILYELTTGQKLFTDDWKIQEYVMKGEPMFPALWPSCIHQSRLYSLGVLAQSLLQVDPLKRPGALETNSNLLVIQMGEVPGPGIRDGNQKHVIPIRPPSPVRNIGVIQLHYRRPPPKFQSAYLASSRPTPEQLRQLEEAARMLGGYLQHPPSGLHSLGDYQHQENSHVD